MISGIKNKKGFTLVETIIYMAIIAAVLTNFISYNLSISAMRNKVYSVQEVQANSRVATNLLTQKIRGASEVIEPAKGIASNTLILGFDNGSTVTFSLIDEQLVLTEDADDPISVTSTEVKVSTLDFTNVSVNNQKDNINIILNVEYQADSIDFSFSNYLNTSVSIRN